MVTRSDSDHRVNVNQMTGKHPMRHVLLTTTLAITATGLFGLAAAAGPLHGVGTFAYRDEAAANSRVVPVRAKTAKAGKSSGGNVVCTSCVGTSDVKKPLKSGSRRLRRSNGAKAGKSTAGNVVCTGCVGTSDLGVKDKQPKFGSRLYRR